MKTIKSIAETELSHLVVHKDFDEERLRRNMYLPDREKLRLFVKMLRINTILKKMSITHK